MHAIFVQHNAAVLTALRLPMHMLTTVESLRDWRKTAGFVALVPTMGNLHAGHIALCHAARQQAAAHGGQVVVSIFVNPIQFGPAEDLAKYPRTLEQDCALLADAGVDAVFHPGVEAMYPYGTQTCFVEPTALQALHCGEFRPGHFRGVATVVTKLFNLVQPECAVFGKKDYQQLQVIEGMVRELNMPVQVIGLDTLRANDGLALSSRNGYLSETERAEAPRLYRTLQDIQTAVLAGTRDYARLGATAAATLNAHGWQTDYIRIVDQAQLLPATPETKALVVLAASRLGRARLIDNLEIAL